MLIALLIITGVLRYLFALPKQSGIDKPDGKAEPCVAQTWYQEWKHVKWNTRTKTWLKKTKTKKRGGTLPQITNTEETSEMLAAAWDDYLTFLPSNDNGVILLTLSAPDFCCLTCHLCLLMTSVSCRQYKRQNSLLSHRFRTMPVLIRITGVSSWIRRSAWR